MDVRLFEPEENFRRARLLIEEAAAGGSDVIVLPECWNTGFYPRRTLFDCCDHDGVRTKGEMGELAAKLGVSIVAGSVVDERGGRLYNTAYIFDASGSCVASCDKAHLFRPSHEEAFITPGSRPGSFQLNGVNCGIIICYDLRFPELSRTLALRGMDVLFVPAQWGAARSDHFRTLSLARAIENQCYVASCNACGSTDRVRFGGRSAIIDPWGRVLSGAGEDEMIIRSDCDMDFLRDVRRQITAFSDRRDDLYEI